MTVYRPMTDTERFIAEAVGRVHLPPQVSSFARKMARLASGPENLRIISDGQASFLCDIAVRGRGVERDIQASARALKLELNARSKETV